MGIQYTVSATLLGGISMPTDASKRIMSLLDAANQKKRSLDSAIDKLQTKRDADKARLLKDEMKLSQMSEDSQAVKTKHVRKTVNEAKEVMDEDHELAEMRKKRADIDKKIAEIQHWTSQSEYDDEQKRAEAVSYATSAYNSIYE
jgi:hypothetical protein